MYEKLRKKFKNHDMLGKIFVFGEKLGYVRKNICILAKIMICLGKNPRSPAFLGKEILISGCSHWAKFTLTPTHPPHSKRCSGAPGHI
jgi:hypothetical protein